MNQVELRVDGASVPGGELSPSGTDALKAVLRSKPELFDSWRREPMTALVAGAVRWLALHPPKNLTPEQTLVQCGFTEGLLLALQLMDDPSAVWIDAFRAPEGRKPAPRMDFGTSLDALLAEGPAGK